ncbi:hypothetical protein Tco_0083617 [Tanacetum coccineum]
MPESPFVDSGFVVPVFSPGDDLIACLNKAVAFLTFVASSRFPSTNNQLRTSSNPRNQATIQNDMVTVQQVQGRQGQNYSGTAYNNNATSSRGNTASGIARVVKCYNCQGEGHMASQARTVIPHNAAFQTEDLDTYDSDCTDLSTAQVVLMANISNYGSDVISEVPNSETCLNDMDNQSVHALQDFEQSSVMDFIDNKISSDSNIITYSQYSQETQQATVQDTNLQAQQDLMILYERVKTFEQRLNIDLSSHEKMIDSQMDDMLREKLALKEQIDSLEQNLSKQIKEKESLLQTITVFKSQSGQTLHMLTKPQAFYDNIHKQALGYQNPFLLKKAQRIKPTLLSDDFGKRFTPQQELSAKQAFWLRMSNPTNKPCDASPVKIKAPKELPKVSLVNESLKKLIHLVRFNNVVKIRTIPDARTEVAAVQQSSVDKQCLEIAKKELLLENDRLLQQIMSQDVLLTVMNSMSLIDESVNVERKQNESCDKCFNLEAELLKSQNAFNVILKKNEDLKAQIQDKVFVITSLKNNLRKIKGKEIVDIAAQIPSANTIVPGMFKLNLEPLAPSAKKVVVTPKNKVKKVRFAEPLTSSSNIKQVESLNTSDSNTPVLSSTGLKCSTSKCGSKPTDNKRNDRISQTPSRNMKNKVEAQPRKVNNKNRVVEPICDVNVKHSLLNANSEPICATCKKSMFDGVHDICLLDFVENMNSHVKSAKKHKKQNIWKPFQCRK